MQLVYLESICTKPEIVYANIRSVKISSPDVSVYKRARVCVDMDKYAGLTIYDAVCWMGSRRSCTGLQSKWKKKFIFWIEKLIRSTFLLAPY